MYDKGLGVPQDYVLAYMWFNLGAAHTDFGGRRPIIAILASTSEANTRRGNPRQTDRQNDDPNEIAEAQRLHAGMEAVRFQPLAERSALRRRDRGRVSLQGRSMTWPALLRTSTPIIFHAIEFRPDDLASRALRVGLTTFFQNLDLSSPSLGKKCLMSQGTVKWFNAHEGLWLHPAG